MDYLGVQQVKEGVNSVLKMIGKEPNDKIGEITHAILFIIFCCVAILALIWLLIEIHNQSSLPPQTVNNYEGPVYFGNQASSTETSSSQPSYIEGEITFGSSSDKTTLSDVFNLTPLTWTPSGPPLTIRDSFIGSSTEESDGFYHTSLELNMIILPGLGSPTINSVTPSIPALCKNPYLANIGTVLGGQFTGMIDYRYTINCTSDEQITSTTEFQLNYTYYHFNS